MHTPNLACYLALPSVSCISNIARTEGDTDGTLAMAILESAWMGTISSFYFYCFSLLVSYLLPPPTPPTYSSLEQFK